MDMRYIKNLSRLEPLTKHRCPQQAASDRPEHAALWVIGEPALT